MNPQVLLDTRNLPQTIVFEISWLHQECTINYVCWSLNNEYALNQSCGWLNEGYTFKQNSLGLMTTGPSEQAHTRPGNRVYDGVLSLRIPFGVGGHPLRRPGD